jgi:hypothetical protein
MSDVGCSGLRREQGFRNRLQVRSKLLPFSLVVGAVLCFGIPQTRAGTSGKSNAGTNVKVVFQKEDDDDANFDEPFSSEIDPVGMGNSSLAAPDDIADSTDGCIGTPAYRTWPAYDVTKNESYVDPKDKKSKTRSVFVRQEQLVTVHCGSRLMRSFTRCLRGACPPQQPTLIPDIETVVRRQIGRELLRLEKPQQSLFPKPSSEAPIPGVPFFYGVSDRQFDTIQEFPLTACGTLDCVSVLMRAKPVAVYFDPADGSGKRKTCTSSGPAVSNRNEAKDATGAKNPCFVVFQKAGKFKSRIFLRYEATWTFSQWTLAATPRFGSGTQMGTTSRQLNITVHERQPVVIG